MEDLTIVDQIMKKIEENYRGVFTINGDDQLSSEIYQKIQSSQKNMFNGYNGTFKAVMMSCNDFCQRYDDNIEIRKGGIVYGPYFRFYPGKYIAKFNITASQSARYAVDINVPGKGIIENKELQGSQDNISISFNIDEVVDQVEFRVHNNSDDTLKFHSIVVTVEQPEHQQNGFAETHVMRAESDMAVPPIDLSALEHYDALIQADIEATGRVAACAMPSKTRFLWLKKLIRRVIKVYTAFQIEFNCRITGTVRNLYGKLHSVTDLIKRLSMFVFANQQAVQDLKVQYDLLKEVVERIQRDEDENKHALFLLTKRAITHDQVSEVKWQLEKLRVEINEIKDSIQNLIEEQNDFDIVEQQIDNLRNEGKDLHDKMPILEERQAELQESIHVLENEQKRLFDMIEQLGELQQRYNTQSTDDIKRAFQSEEHHAKEIQSLWKKIQELDNDFLNQWKFNRETNQNLSSIWSTYQTFRQEVFYELDFSIRQQGKGDDRRITYSTDYIVKPTAAEKISQAGGKIRLNLGSGNKIIEGYVNVDARDLPAVDIVAQLSDLPFKEGTIDEILSEHVIEHFTNAQLQNELFPYWKRLLKPNGVLRVIFPDFDAMLLDYQSGEISFSQLAQVVMGGQDYLLDYHYSLLTPERVMEMLEKAGYRNITVTIRGRRNDICRESEIIATK